MTPFKILKSILSWILKEIKMTQISRPQQGKRATYPDCGGYTANEWARLFGTLFTVDETTQGVIVHLSNLAVTNPAGKTISVASGAALVRGHWFVNENSVTPSVASAVTFSPSAPAIGDRIDRVVLVQNNTNAAYSTNLEFPADTTDYGGAASIPAHSCRLAILTGIDGGALRPLIQNAAVDGNIWMIEISRYTITTLSNISVGPTDYRSYAPTITTENIEDDAVTIDKVAANAVGTDQIVNLAVTTAKLDDVSVATGKIADEAVTAAKIANRTRKVFVPFDQSWESGAYGSPFGSMHGLLMTDGVTTSAYGHWRVPEDFVSGLTIKAVLGASSSGNIYGSTLFTYGGVGEVYNTHTAQITSSAVAVTVNRIMEIYETTLAAANIGDTISLEFNRDGGNVLDTLSSDGTFFGWVAAYTADC